MGNLLQSWLDRRPQRSIAGNYLRLAEDSTCLPSPLLFICFIPPIHPSNHKNPLILIHFLILFSLFQISSPCLFSFQLSTLLSPLSFSFLLVSFPHPFSSFLLFLSLTPFLFASSFFSFISSHLFSSSLLLLSSSCLSLFSSRFPSFLYFFSYLHRLFFSSLVLFSSFSILYSSLPSTPFPVPPPYSCPLFYLFFTRSFIFYVYPLLSHSIPKVICKGINPQASGLSIFLLPSD